MATEPRATVNTVLTPLDFAALDRIVIELEGIEWACYTA